MSKTNKLCSYVFLKGKKEGEQCKRPCKGDLCGDHNKKKKEYSKKYYSKKNAKRSKITHKQKMRRLKNCVTDKLPSVNFCLLRKRSIEEAAKKLYMKILGVGLIANPEKYEPLVEEKINKDKNNENIIPTLHYIEYNGAEDRAEKKLKELLEEKETMVRRLKQAKEICELVEKRHFENKNHK